MTAVFRIVPVLGITMLLLLVPGTIRTADDPVNTVEGFSVRPKTIQVLQTTPSPPSISGSEIVRWV